MLARALKSNPNLIGTHPTHLHRPAPTIHARYLPLGHLPCRFLFMDGLERHGIAGVLLPLFTHLLCLTLLSLARLSARPTLALFHTSISLNPRISSLAHPSGFPSEIFSSRRFVFPSLYSPYLPLLPRSTLPGPIPESPSSRFSSHFNRSRLHPRRLKFISHARFFPSFPPTKPLLAIDEHCFSALLICFRFLLSTLCL